MMDQGDFDFNVFLDRKNKNKDKYKEQLLTKDDINKAVEMLKKEKVDKYEILSINPNALKKFNLYKRMAIFLNIPIMLIIPFGCEFLIDFTHPKANMLYALLYTADTFLFVNFFMIYNMLKQAVISINYLVKEDKFEINHFISPRFFKSLFSKKASEPNESTPEQTVASGNTDIVSPGSLGKAPKSLVNPFIGYRNIDTDQKYITEGMCTWHDRHFFDSVLERAKELRGTKVSERILRNKEKRRQGKGNPFS
uniref:Uncharacterized protein n=2 Tax=Euplotes harpa TaxID=151035 RepID=A0A7S3JN72_9SPIT|mmetsp:Transcript_6088/g.7047  ORF Transcript_6088/g.7047 Transcript_6088/m.7047 type:complete len:252 (+) Transcript_6088:152-907(+)